MSVEGCGDEGSSLGEPVAWRVVHFQDGAKNPNVSLHSNKEKAEYVFRRYGTAAEGIKQGTFEPS